MRHRTVHRGCFGALVPGPVTRENRTPRHTDGQAPHPVLSQTVRSWLENPHLSLDFLTAGQRYTAVLTIVLGVLLLAFGLPSGQ